MKNYFIRKLQICLLLGPVRPRYVRVNTLFLTTSEATQNFEDEGWVLSNFPDKNDYDGFIQKISNLDESEFIIDIHIPDLLIFPPKTEFHKHNAYIKGSILLQDKVNKFCKSWNLMVLRKI